MYFEAKPTPTAKSAITTLSLLTALFGIGCSIFGYILLPPAAAFYAALLVMEDKKRLSSIIVPIVIFIFNFLINGFYSLDGIAYLVLGLIVYLAYKNAKSKSATTFYLTALTVIMMLISLLFVLFSAAKSFDFSAAMAVLEEVYDTVKEKVITVATSIVTQDKDGVFFFTLNPAEAEELFNSSLYVMIPFVVVFAFLLTGITFKLFEGRILRYCNSKERILKWKFTIPSGVAYFYVVISIISMLSSDTLIGISLSCIDLIFIPIFCYFGLRLARSFFDFGKSMNIILFIAAIIVAPSVAIRVLAYMGVYYTIAINKRHANTDEV